MNNEQRTLYVRQEMLKLLNECGGNMLSEPAFFAQLNIAVEDSVTFHEFHTQLKWLEGNAYIAGIHPELGGPAKWKITDKGRVAL
jgi:hypothetical protein